ncbi:hypothetical protein [Nocardia goodfellowii]|uniref:ESX-1 secretion-associated protein n=1 Tax=Nocardia goodfellowii TaxID=882446 RepID=A0ABS4Q6L5_9NOCA|nr:hypothetical protein [Nocardia goodfellowii]MBP2187335.1 hypothetical protein [Nocardia goodfellowii]
MAQTITGSVVVDQVALATASNDLARSAATVRNYIGEVTNNLFGAGRNGAECEAGRRYADQGKQVQAALETVGNWLEIWTTATEDTAAAVGKTAVTMSNVDENNARATNKVG